MKNKEFTLPEIVAVLSILALIIVIAIPTYNKISKNMKDNTYDSKVKTIELAALKYLNESNTEQSISFTATKLVLDNYYSADRYVGEMPWIENLRDKNDNLNNQLHDNASTIGNAYDGYSYNCSMFKP